MVKRDKPKPFNWRGALRWMSDETIKQPLWCFPPEAVKPVISERRRRFGWDDGDFDPEYN